ncbi:MAG: Ig-like domain-containing protein, partial [Psychrosphaera sp.]|nr:Ig-like domain-containing protein [Psychrosphaera sp.]
MTSVQAGFTLCVKASLFTGSDAIEGEIVDFTVSQGSLRPASATTDATGIATTYIDSTEAMLGASTISAAYLTQSAAVNYAYTSVPSQSPTVSLTLFDDSCTTQVNSIEAGNTFCLKAGLIQNGQPIAGEVVSFASPIGTLRESTVLTDADGFAINYLDSTSTITGAASATASFGSFSAVQNYQFTALSTTSNSNISLSVLDESCTNALNSVSAGSSLCLQASLIRENSPVGDAIITFAAPLGTLRQTTALTNSNGVASVLLDSATTVFGAAIASASFESVSASQNYQFTDSPSQQSTRLTLDIRDSGCQALTNNTSAGTALCLILTLTKDDVPQVNELISFTAPLGPLSQSSTLTDTDGIA